MIISIYLDDKQAERLVMIYDRVTDPEIRSIDDYATELFSKLLNRMWEKIREDILN